MSVTRRTAMGGALAASVGALLTACGGPSATGPSTVRSSAAPPSTVGSSPSPSATSADTTGGATTVSPHRTSYGSDPSQWVDRYDVPPGVTRRPGAVAVIHGGFWRSAYDASLGAPLAADLAGRGYTAWNIEYRRVGDGGGWPATLDDVRTALTRVVAAGGDVVTLGHSAGGQLGVWAASQPTLTGIVGAVSQAGVLDLVGAADNDVGGTAVQDLLGGTPKQVPDRYASASPLALVPLHVPVRCVHAEADVNVPYLQSQTYVAAARAAGADATLTTVAGDHFTLIDVTSAAWTTIVGLLADLLPH